VPFEKYSIKASVCRRDIPSLNYSTYSCTGVCTRNELLAVTFLWFPANKPRASIMLMCPPHCFSVKVASVCPIPALADSQEDLYIHSVCRRHHSGMMSLGLLWSYLQQSGKTVLARSILRSVFRFTGVWSTLIIYAATTACHSIDTDRP
jgi:hypothetical protein